VRAVGEYEDRADTGKHNQRVVRAYRSVKQQARTVVLAEQIMISPVLTLEPQTTIDAALTLFRTKPIRHLPVVSSAGLLVGMVSERDVLRHLARDTQSDAAPSRQDRGGRIEHLMTSPVLTASEDTDIRYIARLFVEQRVGALPIVTAGELKGIIARSDVLNAVMRHFALELWA
jgi:acetoin utilization protein AcuB